MFDETIVRKVQETQYAKTISLPSQICEKLRIKKGSFMCIELIDDKIVMTPATLIRQDAVVAGAVNKTHAKVGVAHG
ncbi:MAG: AbrB/MazE/SpoVT family DNA-binding domain-containing protein [Methanosarcinaceae archaeon]|nr:AbrB/MazE/SpoVT family DNA-binding domain-containing protein [Methanosarcinaceae archaeon]